MRRLGHINNSGSAYRFHALLEQQNPSTYSNSNEANLQIHKFQCSGFHGLTCHNFFFRADIYPCIDSLTHTTHRAMHAKLISGESQWLSREGHRAKGMFG